jgi:polyferredoxin
MECIHCTQCADACDAIMDSVDKPRGLVRYTSREALAGEKTHLLRPRTILYPAALTIFLGSLVWGLTHKASADVTILRGIGEPYTVEADGRVRNQVRIKVANRSGADRTYHIDVIGAEAGQVVIPINPYPVASGANETTSLFVLLPASAFTRGERFITVRLDDQHGFRGEYKYRLLGPEE